jgi:hypothetical protein
VKEERGGQRVQGVLAATVFAEQDSAVETVNSKISNLKFEISNQKNAKQKMHIKKFKSKPFNQK